MMPERWTSILGHIKDNFEVIDQGVEEYEDEGGTKVEYIVFNGPLGKMKLEFISKPVVLDKKTIYSKRIGSETKVEYVYSPDEKSHRFLALKWDDGQDDWEEIDSKNFTL